MGGGDNGCHRGNIQQITYIPQTEQHFPFGLMLLRLGNVTIMCMCMCVHVWCVCVGIYSLPGCINLQV